MCTSSSWLYFVRFEALTAAGSRLLTPGLYCCVVWQTFSSVSEDIVGPIIRAMMEDLKMDATKTSVTSVNFYQISRHYNPSWSYYSLT